MRIKPLGALLAALVFSSAGWAATGDPVADATFNIVRFQVDGNSILSEAELQELVAPFAGEKRNYGDVQKALEALEGAYRNKGYGTVQVYVPEQELTSGVVRLSVTEAAIGKITVQGNTLFDEANIRASLPLLKEGQPPNMRQLSENIQLANENPAKQVEVTLGVGEKDNTVDAKVKVAEENPEKYFVTLDNTGSGATGKSRVGFAYQNANFLGGDKVLTLAYTTSADAPGGVKVDVYSAAFRMPFYDIGDSLDIIYGNSNTNTPVTQNTTFGLSGKGEVFAARWNHLFPRAGEYSSRLVFGLDYKHLNTRCAPAGFTGAIDPPTPNTIPSCVPYTVRPVSATYSGKWENPGYVADFNVGLAYNLGMGVSYTGGANPAVATKNDYYSFMANRPVPNNFTVVRYGGSYAQAMGDWQVRAAMNGQYSGTALVEAERFGLAGSNAVRGFNERAEAADSGYVVNLEAYSPDFASVVGAPGNLRAVLFYDFARGSNKDAATLAVTGVPATNGIAAAGAGLRYSLDKNVSIRFDLATVVKAGVVSALGTKSEGEGDWRGHFALSVGF